MLPRTLSRPSVLLTRSLLYNKQLIVPFLGSTLAQNFNTNLFVRSNDYALDFKNRNYSTSKSMSQFHFGVVIVPQGEKWIIERLGQYNRTLDSGIHFLIPFVDRIAYKHSTKEIMFDITKQTAITKDNVQIHLDGVVYFRVEDPYLASYEIQDYFGAITNLAQTTMRGEIGKITLDTTFAERQNLNKEIVEGIEKVADGWGIKIKRYEIRDITVPQNIKNAMDFEAEAERKKRRTILDSQADRESQENIAKGKKIATTLVSEANMIEEMNIAKGEAFAITTKAEAQANAIRKIAEALNSVGGDRAIVYRIAESYIENFGKLAQRGNTIIIPANVNDTVSMVTQATTIFDKLRSTTSQSVEPPVISKAQAIDRLAQELDIDRSQLMNAVEGKEKETSTQ
jgi:regulator of protease activity HflC (stomatin/prohibitin superfamily)